MSEEKKYYPPAHEVVLALLHDNPRRGVDVAHALYAIGNAKIPVKSIPDLEEVLETTRSGLMSLGLHTAECQAGEVLRVIRSQLEDTKSSDEDKGS